MLANEASNAIPTSRANADPQETLSVFNIHVNYFGKYFLHAVPTKRKRSGLLTMRGGENPGAGETQDTEVVVRERFGSPWRMP